MISKYITEDGLDFRDPYEREIILQQRREELLRTSRTYSRARIARTHRKRTRRKTQTKETRTSGNVNKNNTKSKNV